MEYKNPEKIGEGTHGVVYQADDLTTNRPENVQYVKLEKLGEGAYGVVYKAYDLTSKRFVAMKEIHMDDADLGVPHTSIREITLLKKMDHTNIVRLQDVFVPNQKRLCLILEYMDFDMEKHMASYPLLYKDPRTVKIFLLHILHGIAYCHSQGVLHRDLKPQNLLINENSKLVKVADLGLSRECGPVKTLTHEVVTLWYRAPEILLGCRRYSTPIDIWSVGCIFAEMVNKVPLFDGDTEIAQLHKIFSVMGTPNKDTWPGVTSLSDFAFDFLAACPTCPAKDLATMVPDLDAFGLDLLSKMLCLDPSKRITAKSALEHEYFKDVGDVH